MYRIAVIALVIVLAGLQYRLWIAEGGWAEVHRVSQREAELHRQNMQAAARNDALQAEIRNLKSGRQATEGRARSDLGMIRPGETFFLTIAPRGDGAVAADGQARR